MIESEPSLKETVKLLKDEDSLAFDVEADSMFHFREKVCLLQIGTYKQVAVVDPLIVQDLSYLKPIFSNKSIRKISHGSDYDVRSLYRDFGIEINNLFDTQLASKLLGVRQTGLDAVVKQRFNVTLDKKYQKKDWSERPLPKAMLKYAAGDVSCLIELAVILEKELVSKGRLDWFKEECEALSKVRPHDHPKEPLFLKFKGAGRLSGRNLALLELLLNFRQDLAEKKDRPLFKIIANNAIIKIAETMPQTIRRLKRSRVLSKKQIEIYGKDIIALVKQAFEINEQDLPIYPRRKKIAANSPGTNTRLTALKAWRAAKAKHLDIEQSLILNKVAMNSISNTENLGYEDLERIEEIKNWQKHEFGTEIVQILKNI